MTTFKTQKEFPHLKLFKRKFEITDNTVFAWDGCIYANHTLTNDLLIHEETHLKQQEKYNKALWLKDYLEDTDFRLKMEVQAYKNQLSSIKDRERRNRMKILAAIDLSSSLYGNIATFPEAIERLT